MHEVDPSEFASSLESWFGEHARELPWRVSPRDPYWSLVSEFMLQQTQVSRVIEKFASFTSLFPDIRSLASAPEDDVIGAWSGLGYYRRARMLHACAKAIVEHHDGIIPSDPDELEALPGIGRYTAGAMSSIVFDTRTPIVDGNVVRVMLRIHNNDSGQTEPATLRWTWDRAREMVEHSTRPAVLNEGMMELGALVCTPKKIGCDHCPIKGQCGAYQHGTMESIPPPKPRAKRKAMWCTTVIVRDDDGRVLMHQRDKSGMWAQMFESPTLERDDRFASSDEVLESLGIEITSSIIHEFTHQTTHRIVHFVVYEGRCATPERSDPSYRFIEPSGLNSIGISNAQRKILEAVLTDDEQDTLWS